MVRSQVDPRASGILFLRHTGGHRQNYLSVLQNATGFETMNGQDKDATFGQLLNADQLLFATAEDDLRTFISVSVRRSIRNKKTVALVMGAGRCFEPGHIKYKIKLNTFRMLRKFSNIRMLSILPFYLDSRFNEVTSDWIYDPQFWDLATVIENGQVPHTNIALEMASLANGRNILLFLGSPSDIKGFSFLENILLAQPSLARNMLIAVAGRINPPFKAAQSRLLQLGVWFIDRLLDEDEVVSLKAASSILWACYEQSYNSSSGIFGRAMQLDKNVVVRSGSYLESIAGHVDYPIDTCVFGDLAQGITVLERASKSTISRPKAQLSRHFYNASVPKLRHELNLVP
jgi:hypothetical protein